MSRRNHIYPRCPATGKVRFGEHKDATQALRQARQAAQSAARQVLPSRRREARSYRCPHCRGWHLTSWPTPTPTPTPVAAA
jgi:hypothetical protein